MLKRSGEKVSLQQVLETALAALGDAEHLVKMTAYRNYREKYLRAMLDETAFAESVRQGEPVNGPEQVAGVRAKLEKLKQDRNWLAIVKHYKIKASGAPNKIAKKLGFLGSDRYERALVKALQEDDQLRATISSIIPNPFTQAPPAVEAA